MLPDGRKSELRALIPTQVLRVIIAFDRKLNSGQQNEHRLSVRAGRGLWCFAIVRVFLIPDHAAQKIRIRDKTCGYFTVTSVRGSECWNVPLLEVAIM
jgi:hypothetical protein